MLAFLYELLLFILSVLVLKVGYSNLSFFHLFSKIYCLFVLLSLSNSCFFHDTGGQTSIRYLLFTWCYFLFLFCLEYNELLLDEYIALSYVYQVYVVLHLFSVEWLCICRIMKFIGISQFLRYFLSSECAGNGHWFSYLFQLFNFFQSMYGLVGILLFIYCL